MVRNMVTHELVRGLRALLSTTADLTFRLSSPSLWSPEPGSLGDSELRNTEVGPKGPWGELPVRTAYAMGCMGIHAAAEYARALHAVLTVDRPPLVPETLARGSLEIAASTSWLLQEDIGARRRVCRLQLMRIKSALELERAVNEIGVSNANGEYGETPDQVRRTSDELGLASFLGKGNDEAAACESETRPNYTTRARRLLDDWGAKGAYALYSGAAHGELYSLWRSFRAAGAPVSGQQQLFELAPDPTGLHRATHAVLLAMVAPLERAALLFGWHSAAGPGADLSAAIDAVNAELARLAPPSV